MRPSAPSRPTRAGCAAVSTSGPPSSPTRPSNPPGAGMGGRLPCGPPPAPKPLVLFLDEPTTGLDPRSRLGMWGVIRSLVASGTTPLLTTQYLDEADELAEEIL